ncbi:hypothetical protein [uncultured Parasutterella sp.]|uniref:hypothetical protein n=1 Tax=uncultured Parasutterella sp. TaxID=1263098 RepID=UPI0025B3667E|nr:hypothetical protein [uncultured Parasutterella sp.]
MTEIELSITRLAALGRSPYQIEVELGFPPYTIHQKYHAALQEGYARMARLEDSKSNESMTAPAEPIERQEKTTEEMSQREKLAETRRLYYQSHRSEIREKQRRYYQANKEKVAQYQRQYQQANKGKIAEARREYYRANKEKFAEWSRQYKARKRQEKQKTNQQGESAWPENQMPTGDQNGAGLK